MFGSSPSGGFPVVRGGRPRRRTALQRPYIVATVLNTHLASDSDCTCEGYTLGESMMRAQPEAHRENRCKRHDLCAADHDVAGSGRAASRVAGNNMDLVVMWAIRPRHVDRAGELEGSRTIAGPRVRTRFPGDGLRGKAGSTNGRIQQRQAHAERTCGGLQALGRRRCRPRPMALLGLSRFPMSVARSQSSSTLYSPP